jgi:hypothetical protein
VSLKHDTAMSGAKRCYRFKISKCGFIKVMIDIAEKQESVI